MSSLQLVASPLVAFINHINLYHNLHVETQHEQNRPQKSHSSGISKQSINEWVFNYRAQLS